MSKNPATDPLDIPRWVLFTEDLLPDWYEPWLEPAQRAFRETRIHALEWIARKRLLQGEHWLAIEACGAALTAEPLRQSAHLLMAEIYRAEGNSRTPGDSSRPNSTESQLGPDRQIHPSQPSISLATVCTGRSLTRTRSPTSAPKSSRSQFSVCRRSICRPVVTAPANRFLISG